MNDESDQIHYREMRKVACLTIAGSDSGGNAGVQADLRAFHVFGVHGCTVFTALTAQNPFGVQAAVAVAPDFIGRQLDAVLEPYGIQALKTGMLATSEIIETVAGHLTLFPRIIKVVDPVMVATSGAPLLEEGGVEALKKSLLPIASLITPNLPEAEALSGRKIDSLRAMSDAAKELHQRFGCAVLVKGGHLAGHPAEDALYDGEKLYRLSTPVVDDPVSTHGTGCSLSAAIAASAACGHSLVDAVIEGKAYVYEAIRTAVPVGEAAGVLGTPARIPRESVLIKEEK